LSVDKLQQQTPRHNRNQVKSDPAQHSQRHLSVDISS
jgi:hypothetical protein